MKRIFLALVPFSLLAVLLLLNVRLYRPGDDATVQAQLRHLEGALGAGAAERMQEAFPEGYVFTWALYGLTSARQAGSLEPGDPRRAHLLAQVRRAMDAVASDRARSTFEPEMNPPYGAFYASWALYLRAEHVRAAGPGSLTPAEVAAFTRACDRFAQALSGYGSPFLESYPGWVWPADTAPGIAALGIHDQVVAPRYGETIRRWVADARARVDPATGALTHTAEPGTGRPTDGPRGESLALMSRLLVDADPRFAREQYALLREHFLHDVLGVPGFLEYPRGTRGPEDVDSGPIVFGMSGPAVVVGAAAARVHGDQALANAILGGVEVVGVPVQVEGRRVYAAGELPVGDALIAWTRASPAAGPEQRSGAPAAERWFLPFHALSAVLAAGFAWWGMRILRPARRSVGGYRRRPRSRPPGALVPPGPAR